MIIHAKYIKECIPFHFLSPFNYGLNKVLVALNADINVRESLLLININIDGYIVGELKLTRFGYDYIERSMMFDENDTFTTEVLAEKMIGDCNPVKIILFSEIPNLPIMKQMEQEVFKAMVDKIVKLEGNLDEYNPPFCIEFAKWMFDRSKIRFHSITKTSTQYCIGNFFESGKKRILLHIKSNMPLPFHPYDIVPNSYFEYFFGYYDDNLAEYVVMETFNLDPDSHGYKIILNVDVNSFPSYQTQGFILKEITGLVKRLNDQEKKLLKIPVITFFNNSSVICVHDGHEYNFLENWNGAFGEQLYISFDKKEPKFGKKAFKAYKTKPSTVIFDILTILAQNIDEVCVDAWGFTLITDEFNEVTFEFECFDGTRKTVTPDFLLGLLIKEHIKAIEHELGNSPPAICFNILDSKGKEFLIESIEEACKALKVDCSFYEQN
uniref:Uncharacterized protein n=1 Tax=Panagrolaimus superbus TaxID=310955 RepID=A0A914Z248_9BILA